MVKFREREMKKEYKRKEYVSKKFLLEFPVKVKKVRKTEKIKLHHWGLLDYFRVSRHGSYSLNFYFHAVPKFCVSN